MSIILQILFLIFINIQNINAAPISVKNVSVQCLNKIDNWGHCDDIIERTENLVGTYQNQHELEQKLQFYFKDRSFSLFEYQVEANQLKMMIEFKPIINKIIFKSILYGEDVDNKYNHLKKIIPIKEENFFRETLISDSISVIKKYIIGLGHYAPEVTTQISADEQGGNIVNFIINEGATLTIRNITISGSILKENIYIKKKLSPLIDTNFSENKIKDAIDIIKKKYYDKGYFLSKFNIDFIYDANLVDINIKIKLGERYYFTATPTQYFSFKEIEKEIKNDISLTNKITNRNIIEAVDKMYRNLGLFHSEISLSQVIDSDLDTIHYHLKIIEGKKAKILKLDFIEDNGSGQGEIIEQLHELFFKSESDLISNSFYDEEYVMNFTEKMKKFLVSIGYLYSKCESPKIKFKKNKVHISYHYQLQLKAIISNVKFKNIPPQFIPRLKNILKNKEKHPLDATSLDHDLDTAENYIREQGYLFAQIYKQNSTKNTIIKEEDILQFNRDSSKLDFVISAKMGNIIYFNKLIIYGNLKTKNIVIEREIPLVLRDILTPSKIQMIKSRISNKGIFSQVKVQTVPLSEDPSMANILIYVQEQNSGYIEVTPGIRQDLGYKLGIDIGHNNLMNMDRSLSFKGQVNKRFNNSSIDQFQKEKDPNLENKTKIEFLGRASYFEPYFLGFDISQNMSWSYSRRRYLKFDADIFSFSMDYKKQFTSFFSLQMQYQLEFIRQYNSLITQDRINHENGNYRIGAIIPSLVIDFRDHALNPTRGIYLDLTVDIARSSFFSSIDKYDKWVSRNNFYLPLDPISSVLALSVSFGEFKNMSAKSIPLTKLFRLNGPDIVRGFIETDINRPAGSNLLIDQIPVLQRVYYTNIKLEFRHFLSKDFAIVPFYDAGRMFIDHFTPLKLRASAGLGLRYITPVGPIEFDFGVKLHRKRMEAGNLESPSEIHFTIGLF